MLEGLLAKAIASATAQFALLVGEAGIGKSRLVTEFFRTLDERPGFFCTWRQGRCPPYGEDLAYWPLREIVTAHAGILQTDRPHVVEKKLRRALGDIADHEWMVTRLLPLVGLPAAQTEHDDNFAAWQLLLEGIARRQPTIVVIEDIHWATEATLAFLGHLIRGAPGVPLLFLWTARPEFLKAHAEFADT